MEKSIFELKIEEIKNLINKQSEITFELSEALLMNLKESSLVSRFKTLEEANMFIENQREKNIQFSQKLTDLMTNNYLDDVIGQKLNSLLRLFFGLDENLTFNLTEEERHKIKIFEKENNSCISLSKQSNSESIDLSFNQEEIDKLFQVKNGN